MAVMLFAAGKADEIFTRGPENLVADSPIIVFGRVSAPSKHVLATTEPSGPNAIPLKWIITGSVDNPVTLKGSFSGPIKFSMPERSLLLFPSRDHEEWEDDYGEFEQSDEVVLFGRAEDFPTKALPSGTGERDLVSLVRDIVSIEGGAKGEQGQAWLSYLNDAPLEQGRKSALRILVQMPIPWKQFAPALSRLFSNPSLTNGMLGFSFAIVTHGLTQGRWGSDEVLVADFLAQQFETERRPKLLLQYLLSLKLVLKYSMEQAERVNRESITRRVATALRQRESTLSKVPELEEQYRQIRTAYSGVL